MHSEYSAAIDAEKRIYRDQSVVHDLPPIFHYWSEKHLAPLLRGFGFESPDDFFLKTLSAACSISRAPRFASLGSGNCDLEVGLARDLLRKGHRGFTIECIDLNPVMLDRGRELARDAGIEACLTFAEADLNRWRPACRYHAVLANQSLHHVVNLEGLFGSVQSALETAGVFVISDMIGRNGHLRWPEALAIVYEFWTELPASYRLNTQLERYEEIFEDWDSSGEGFEGVRSQDILPLLNSSFQFHLFIPFGNVIDPFTDRAFGFHFEPAAAWDREFIDRVHARDVYEIERGAITPTHMLAAVSNESRGEPKWPGDLSPSFCIRRPDRLVPAPVRPRETFAACMKNRPAELRNAGAMKRLHLRAIELHEQFRERTAWAVDLERERAAIRQHAQSLEQLWLDRSRWARELEAELERVKSIARHFEMEASLETQRANGLEAELLRCVRHPASYFSRKVLRRVRRAIPFS